MKELLRNGFMVLVKKHERYGSQDEASLQVEGILAHFDSHVFSKHPLTPKIVLHAMIV